jgi:hypothetical protein
MWDVEDLSFTCIYNFTCTYICRNKHVSVNYKKFLLFREVNEPRTVRLINVEILCRMGIALEKFRKGCQQRSALKNLTGTNCR